ncbi:SCP2 sterol-binding domain-containing protein [Aestuariirhabdus sp. Z084]|uniref:ubiquinone biosynthesis accessory factor UbiJ n=1 Tax=Aestuariirhabdus haliotis TaxID=2918751 RepID=UPI00201B3EDF|nr:SCP2 sterol-binding domain-containing protein [Aestuariirhabdus haliotis]MCL6414969.1 SCP2 sterol-binding domain-containing protein [Aestuariirhabdus haliotis]MCL6418901.1 SCP2 sterol-binding domain-containing protein [Aestuariirhabdus haliotis]
MIDPTITMAVLAGIENVLNRLLQRDPPTLARLARMQERSLCIRITDLGFECFVRPQADAVRLLGYDEQAADATLNASSTALLSLLVSDDIAHELHRNEFRIEGDASLIIELQQIARHYELDFEGLMANVVGDVAAHSVSRQLEQGARWLSSSNASLQNAVSEYLQEELNMLPSANEVECFMDDLQQTRLDLDRLEARIAQLQRRFASTDHSQD